MVQEASDEQVLAGIGEAPVVQKEESFCTRTLREVQASSAKRAAEEEKRQAEAAAHRERVEQLNAGVEQASERFTEVIKDLQGNIKTAAERTVQDLRGFKGFGDQAENIMGKAQHFLTQNAIDQAQKNSKIAGSPKGGQSAAQGAAVQN